MIRSSRSGLMKSRSDGLRQLVNLVQAHVRHAVILQEARGVPGGVQREAPIAEQARRWQKVRLVPQGSDGQKDLAPHGQLESGSQDRLQERLRQIVPKTGDLTGR